MCCGKKPKSSTKPLPITRAAKAAARAAASQTVKNTQAPRQTSPVQPGALPGATGMALVEYTGKSMGTKTFKVPLGGGAMRRYRFGSALTNRRKFVDAGDVAGLLAIREDGQAVFRVVEEYGADKIHPKPEPDVEPVPIIEAPKGDADLPTGLTQASEMTDAKLAKPKPEKKKRVRKPRTKRAD